MSVLPSLAVIVIGIGGFHPVASSFEMSALSSGISSRPSASRSVTTGGTSGFEYVSIRYLPDGETWTACVPSSGVSDTTLPPAPSLVEGSSPTR